MGWGPPVSYTHLDVYKRQGIPTGFIPTMWSDFEFWKNLFVGHWKNLIAWMLAAPTFRDVELVFASFMTVLFSMCASVFVAIAAFLVSIRTFKMCIRDRWYSEYA